MKFLKRLFCKHEKQMPYQSYMDGANGRYTVKHVWKCKNCGKVIYGRTKTS